MPSEREVAQLWVEGDQRVARQVVAPLEGSDGRGYVDFYDRAMRKASVRKWSRDADPTDGFDVPPSIDLLPGDYVRYRELGSDRVIRGVLDRNAGVDQFANPLSRPGQIIMAGPDGVPTVIEPPTDPTLDYVLQWSGTDEVPVWVPV